MDLNADLGEAFGIWPMGDDASLIDIVTSANVACGYHAGDASSMRRVCAMAARRGVSVGAQVGYRDLAGFGRRFIDVAPEELTNDVLYQIAALDGIARAEGTRVRYVKPHGALYNAIVTHEEQAAAVVAAVRAVEPALSVYGLPGSAWLRQAADAGLQPVAEAFADRAYTSNGTLVSRRLPHAVLHDPDVIAARVVRMVVEGTIEADDNTVIEVAPQSICVHGDTPEAVAIARAVRQALVAAGVTIEARA
ncbi:LamB/YcsF family protein [Micromonospora sp. DR5-3]|uniref:LamB/YcsF family protein n=1 Tax=unclassified Micromonospora TaxID=2617518 RepID=UPI001CA372B6|nr:MULTISPECIES: 5-oxoprolinase subunit PxpA [unclassified Micromonospora]MCW3815862.1 LamB/YcsF family protein [Micromonospora sp. DR5-3]